MYIKINNIYKRILIASILAIIVDIILKFVLSSEYPLLIKISSDKPLANYVHIDAVTYFGKIKKKISPENITPMDINKNQVRDVTVIIEPLDIGNPKSRNNEVWLYEVASDIETINSEKLSSFIFQPWKYDFNNKAVLFAGGKKAPPLTFKLKASNFVTFKLLRHPWSGMVRITVDNVSEIIDLYASKSKEGPFQKKFLLNFSFDITQQIETTLSSKTRQFKLSFEGYPRLLKLDYLRWEKPELWEWRPGELINLSPNIEILKHDKDSLIIWIKGQDGYISFDNIQKSFWFPNKRDFMLILILWFLNICIIETFRPISKAGLFFRKQLHWAKYSLLCILVWIIYWLSFFPGLADLDSILVQWRQIVNFDFWGGYPLFHTFTNYLVTRIWLSPAMITLTQIFILSAIIGYGLSKFARFGVPLNFLWIICIIFAFSPVMGMVSITPWKDVPYGICLLWLTILMLELIKSKGFWLRESYYNILTLSLVLAFLSLLRHEAVIVVVVFFLILGIVYRSFLKHIVAIFLISALFYGLVKGPLHKWLDVKPVGNRHLYSLQNYQIAAAIAAGTPLFPEEELVLNRILPMQKWHDQFDCVTWDTIIYNPDYNWKDFDRYKKEFEKIWLNLLIRNPMAVVKAHICKSKLIWGAHQWLYTIPKKIETNEFGLSTNSQLPIMREIILLIVSFTEHFPMRLLFWQPSLYFYSVIFLTIIAIIRNKDINWFIFMIPTLLHAASMFIFLPTQFFRYMFGVYLIGLYSFGLLFVDKKKIEEQRRFNNGQ